MTRSFLQRTALVFGAVLALVGTPAATANAQKALVYCPVNVDATGCNAIVTALTGPAFPLGVHRGYDGSGGTVDLKAVDLFSYSVFVVPSLADDASSQPYAKLREPEVVEHLRAALIGRIAMWSGTPDQGATNRVMKDALIQNLAGWASGGYGTARGPGLVALLDASASPGARYDWVRAVTPLPVASDPNLIIYNEARALNPRGTSILTSGAGPIAYTNMATFGFQVPNGAAGVSLDAVGQTGSSQGGQVILLTAEAGNTSAAIVRTDKDDYAPGETVTITGSGWQPGEAVKLTLHMDPLRDSDTELMATADASGNFTNTDFSPQQYDIGVRFVLTAVGQVSGRRAQTTFTDAVGLQGVSVSPASQSVVAGTDAVFTVTVDFNGNGSTGCVATLSVLNLPAGTAATWSPSPGASAPSDGDDVIRTLTISTTVAAPATTITIQATAPSVAGGQGCNGGTQIATATLTITGAPNAAPVLDPIGNKTVNELTTLAFTATATDAPGQTLTFSLDVGAPTGATITPAGAFSWTPTEAQGPGSFPVTIRVTDNGTPALSDFETITITVNEVNLPPVLGTIGPKSVNELAALTFTATATDPDLPPNTLTFSLAAGTDPVPAGATISSSGAFSWTPTEAQGPGTYKFKVVVTDNGTPALSDDEEITVTVAEVNVAPTLTDVPATATIPELVLYTFDANATDPDVPPQGLTFSLDGAPTGASIDPATGVFTWTPGEAQGPGSYPFKVKVFDGVVATEASITITVDEVNATPVLAPIGSQTVNELSALTFTAIATDSDLPPNTLTFSLIGAPAGASINGSTGAFSWTPTEAQGPGSFTFAVRVTDSGSPALFDEETITVTVNEVNVAPQLGAIGNKIVDEETLLSFTATATDADLPPNTLTFSLVAGTDPVPAGATIDPTSGAFSWTPTEAQGPETHSFKVRVTDNGSPALFDEEEIRVTVNEVNKPPVLGAIGNKTVDEETPLTFTATATDPDLPPNVLTFSLVGAPAGATIDPSTGAFSWTPTEDQGPGSFTFTVKVTDNGAPSASDEEQITVTVNEVNKAPTVGTIAPKTVNEGVPLTFTATAIDPDLPPNTLTFSLVSPPAGATINSSTGAFSWTPPDGPASVSITVRVIDNGSPALSDDEVFTVTVSNVNPTATFNAPAGPINEGQTFGISLTSPNDVPADLPTLTYAFDCGSGTYGAPTTTSTKTCPAVDNPGANVRGKVIDDDGGSTEYSASVTIANAPPVLGPITVSPNDVVPINTTITASAPFTDAGVNDTHTGTYAWDDGTPDSPANITETNGSGTASRSHTYTATGVYVVQLTLRDKDGAEVSTTYQYVVVYDPSAGFVTGGGWINSPAGAYVANPTLAGKANFGFVSKYKKGQSIPDGSSEFQFHAAAMNFKSSAYEWLVVAGAKAQFKGAGTINGSGNYGFMIMAIDGQTNGGGGADKFRIKIWDKNNSDAVVYDNQMSASDTADPITLLGGGSIQLHAK